MEEDNDVQRSWSRIRDYCGKLLAKQSSTEVSKKDVDYLGFYAKGIYEEYQYLSNLDQSSDQHFPSMTSYSVANSPSNKHQPSSRTYPMTSALPNCTPVHQDSNSVYPLTATTTTTTTLSSPSSAVITTTSTISTNANANTNTNANANPQQTTMTQTSTPSSVSSSPSSSNSQAESRKQLAQKLQRGSEIFFERICRWCGTGESPEWRRGPDGPKTLCNACGLKLYKRIKREKSLDKKVGSQLNNPSSSTSSSSPMLGDHASNVPPSVMGNNTISYNHQNNIITPQPTRPHYNVSSSHPSQYNLPVLNQYPRVKIQSRETLPPYQHQTENGVNNMSNVRSTYQREETGHGFAHNSNTNYNHNSHHLYYPTSDHSSFSSTPSSSSRSSYSTPNSVHNNNVEPLHSELPLSGFSTSSLPSQYVNDIEFYMNRAENSRYQGENPKSGYISPPKRNGSFVQHSSVPSSSANSTSSYEKNEFPCRWKV